MDNNMLTNVRSVKHKENLITRITRTTRTTRKLSRCSIAGKLLTISKAVEHCRQSGRVEQAGQRREEIKYEMVWTFYHLRKHVNK